MHPVRAFPADRRSRRTPPPLNPRSSQAPEAAPHLAFRSSSRGTQMPPMEPILRLPEPTRPLPQQRPAGGQHLARLRPLMASKQALNPRLRRISPRLTRAAPAKLQRPRKIALPTTPRPPPEGKKGGPETKPLGTALLTAVLHLRAARTSCSVAPPKKGSAI